VYVIGVFIDHSL